MIWLLPRPRRGGDVDEASPQRRHFPAVLIPSAAAPPAGGLPWLPARRRRSESAAEPMRRRIDPVLLQQPTAEARPIGTVGNWSQVVTFDAGDEWRVTVEGPAATNPRLRLALRFAEN